LIGIFDRFGVFRCCKTQLLHRSLAEADVFEKGCL
jgi:hypothetical protein